MPEKENLAVSVIIPVYNSAPYLRQSLDCLAAQTLREIEILCVDDGSTDDSPAILEEYARRDARFCVLRQSHSNAGAARNAGLARARGKYLSFLDSDDLFDPAMLEKAVRRAEETRAEICVFRAEQYYERTGERKPLVPSLMPERCPAGEDVFSRRTNRDHLLTFTNPAPWNKLFLAEFVRANDLVFQSLPCSNDTLFVLSALALAERITTLDESLLTYRRQTADSLTSRRDSEPLVFYTALDALRRRLVETGVYAEVEPSFLAMALRTTLWALEILQTPDAFETAFHFIRGRVCDELALFSRDRDYYARYQLAAEYDRMREVAGGSALGFAIAHRRFGFGRNERTEKELQAKTKELQKKTQELEALRASSAFRLGRALTAPLRALKRLIRKLRGH